MMEPKTDGRQGDENHGRRFTAANIALLGFLAIAAFFLIAEHRAHLFGWLPLLLILACPLLHFFMHGKHGGHGGGDASRSGRQQPPHRH